MEKEKTRLARLTNIITQLQTGLIITAKQIAEKHRVSIRTIYRDIRTLEQSGIPIITEEGKGFSLMDGYHLPPVMFSEDEANALITTEKLILKNKDKSLILHYQNAVMKIKSVLKNKQIKQAEFLSNRIQIRNNPESEKTSDLLIPLQSSIINFNVITITYFSLVEIETIRDIEPFAIYTTQENWILIAFCRKRNEFRSFRLDRIRYMQITDQHFEAHKLTLQEYMEKCQKNFSTLDISLTHE